MPVLGTAWQGPAPRQVWWFLGVSASLCSPPPPPFPSISSCLCLKFNWPFVPPHSEWAQATSTNSQPRALIALYLSCPLLLLRTHCTPPLLHSSSDVSFFIAGRVSLLVGVGGQWKVIYCPFFFLSSSCSCSLWWLAFICGCSASFKHSTFSPLLCIIGLFFSDFAKVLR